MTNIGMYLIASIMALLTLIPSLQASPCCGSRSAMPNLITGDFRAQMGLAFSNSAITESSGIDGQITNKSNQSHEVQETLSLSTAYLFDPYWQLNLSVPVRKNSYQTSQSRETDTALGDIKFGLAYEALPELSYSFWRPRVFVYSTLTLPTGRSSYEAQNRLATDISGRGFYTTSIGAAAFKIFTPVDLYFASEFSRGFKRNFETNSGPISVNPRYTFSSSVGAGISPWSGQWRYGFNLSYNMEARQDIEGRNISGGQARYLWDTQLNASTMLNNYSIVFSYSDQTLIQKAKNIGLSKTLGLSLMKFIDL